MTTINFSYDETNYDFIFRFEDENRFLSNFWPCQVTLPEEKVLIDDSLLTLPEMEFKSVEHAYVAWKTLSLDMRKHIQTLTAGKAKKVSREDGFIIRPDIEDEKRVKIMRHLILQKFSERNSELLIKLLATGSIAIVEGNTWHDTFFGFDLIKGFGCNHLGLLIMEIRALRQA